MNLKNIFKWFLSLLLAVLLFSFVFGLVYLDIEQPIIFISIMGTFLLATFTIAIRTEFFK